VQTSNNNNQLSSWEAVLNRHMLTSIKISSHASRIGEATSVAYKRAALMSNAELVREARMSALAIEVLADNKDINSGTYYITSGTYKGGLDVEDTWACPACGHPCSHTDTCGCWS